MHIPNLNLICNYFRRSHNSGLGDEPNRRVGLLQAADSFGGQPGAVPCAQPPQRMQTASGVCSPAWSTTAAFHSL